MSSDESVLCAFDNNGALLGKSIDIVSKEFAEKGLLGLGISTTERGETMESLACAMSGLMPRYVVDGGEIVLGVPHFLGALSLMAEQIWGFCAYDCGRSGRFPGMVTWILGLFAFAATPNGTSMEEPLRLGACLDPCAKDWELSVLLCRMYSGFFSLDRPKD